MKLFENFDFKVLYLLKMCPIFVGSVHNFGKSDDDIIHWSNLIKESWTDSNTQPKTIVLGNRFGFFSLHKAQLFITFGSKDNI